MGTFTTLTTDLPDGRCSAVITAPDGTEIHRSVEDDEAAATQVASTWRSANLASCCINGDQPTVSEALGNWGLPVGRFEIVERPDSRCVVRGPARTIQSLLEERRAHLCPPLTPDP